MSDIDSSRNRLWKVVLQELADKLELSLHVCHFPPGTSKWNKIEHGLFCFITKNWRGRPLRTYKKPSSTSSPAPPPKRDFECKRPSTKTNTKQGSPSARSNWRVSI